MEGGPPTFRQGFTCPALLKDQHGFIHTGLSPAMAGLSRPFCLPRVDHWPVPRSLVTTSGISVDVFSSRYLRYFSSPGLPRHTMYSCDDTLAGGLPHSDIHGSTPARGSPWLFAACHVLHRLLVPRHPPNALLSLETLVPGPKSGDPPCTETILSSRRPISPSANPEEPVRRPKGLQLRKAEITLAQHTTVRL